VSGTSRHAAVHIDGFRAVPLPDWFIELWERAAQSFGGTAGGTA
jgi:hypothetical protein